MKWSVKGIELLRSPLGVMVVIPAPHDNDLAKLDKDKEYVIEIKKKSKSRSMNANAYCWVLCQKIAKELSKNGYTSKEDVYRKAIKDCGHFSYVPVREDAVERYIQIWQGHGLGWLAEDIGECQNLKGYHNIMCYHGSSVYNTKEMARLIDCLVDECNQLGIQLEDSDYIQSLVKEWGNEQTEKSR
jgi:conserved domain protein